VKHHSHLLGLDVGTTNVKAVVFTPDGRATHAASRPTPTHALPDGQGVHRAGDIWEVVSEVIRDAVEPLQGEVAGVAVASMGEEGFPLDAEGRPLSPAIVWYDTRTLPQAARWREQTDESRVYEISGLSPRPIYTIHKLAWLQEHEPDVWENMRTWAPISGYVSFRLSGALCMDLSQASRTGLLDLRRRTWSEELLALARVPRDVFPELVESGAKIGEITGEAARQTGLRRGTAVAAGGHDHICGALAAGIVGPGGMLHSGGTAEGVVVALDGVALSADTLRDSLSLGCHVVPGEFYATGGLHSGGVLNWYLDVTGRRDRRRSYVDLAEEARTAPPGARGVIFLPYVYGQGPPASDPHATGSFLGLRAHHTQADLGRAVFEGLAYDVRRLTDALRQDFALRIDAVTAIGGLGRARLWSELKAALLNLTVRLLDTPEAVALGAAMLAGLAAGVYPDVARAIIATQRPNKTIRPDPLLVQEYQSHYARWLSVDAALRNALCGRGLKSTPDAQ
jgi:xylulokinase